MKPTKSVRALRNRLRTRLVLESLEGRDAPAHFVVNTSSYDDSANSKQVSQWVDPDNFLHNYSDSHTDSKQGSGAGFSAFAEENDGNNQVEIVGSGLYSQSFDDQTQLYAESDPAFLVGLNTNAFDGSGSATGNSTFTVTLVPDAGEQNGDPAIVTYSVDVASSVLAPASNLATGSGSAHLTVTSAAPDGSAPLSLSIADNDGHTDLEWHDVMLPIGTTFTVTETSQQSGAYASSSPSGDWVQIQAIAGINMAVQTFPDIVAKFVQFNPTGGVEFQYAIKGQDLPNQADFALYWGDNTGPIGTAAARGMMSQTAIGTYNQFVDDLAPPPQGTTKLYLKLNDSNLVTNELTLDNNTASCAFVPQVDIASKYGIVEKPDVFGRFFSGVSIPNETFTITLSASLGSLVHDSSQISVKLGDQTLPVHPASQGNGWDHRTYVTSDTDLGRLNGSTPLVVTVLKGSKPWEKTKATVDVLPLPKWMTTLHITGKFNAATWEYVFGGKLFDFNSDKVMGNVIPPAITDWLPAGLNSGVNANANLQVFATFDPTAAPDISGDTHFHGTYRGKHLFDYDGTLPPDAVKLDNRTLAFQSATFKQTTTGNGHIDDVFGTAKLTKGFFKLLPKLNVDVAYSTTVTVVMGVSGPIWSQSSANFEFDGKLSGTAEPEVSLGAEVDSALGVLGKIWGSTNPAVAAFNAAFHAAADFLHLVPKLIFTTTIDGELDVLGQLGFGGSGIIPSVHVNSFHGKFVFTPKISAQLSWLGFTSDPYTADAANKYLSVSKTF
jgi:hypothetical protein